MVVFATATASKPISPPSTSAAAAGSSSETAGSSPPSQPEQLDTEPFHHQFRKGKYVSPVWKPNEMLWLARAWRLQYQTVTGSGHENPETGQPGRGKTRAEKDREVAEFLNRNGINRDAKTAGTKWDNMLGEFRKVYEWERGGEGDRFSGKTYFRLSPYERKQHRLPASFDEEVFEELAQFMGPRVRAPSSRGVAPAATATLPPPPPPPPPHCSRDDDTYIPSGRGKRLALTTIGDHSGQFPYSNFARGSTLFSSSLCDPAFETIPTQKDLRRIGKIRMTWEESMSLWAEEGETHHGRIRVNGSSFLSVDELMFFDDSMVVCSMESFDDGPLKGLSLDKFMPGQHLKVFGRRKSTPSASSSSSGVMERAQFPFLEPLTRQIPAYEFQDPSEHYLSCLRVSPVSLPSIFELSWHLQEPPPEDLRFPVRKDVFRDLPPGKDLFFTTSSSELLDCRAITYDIISPVMARLNPNFAVSSKDSLIPLWEDCVNRIVSKFCPVEIAFMRKPSSSNLGDDDTNVQDQWPNVIGFVKGFGLWRGEEADNIREGEAKPSSRLAEKLLWSYNDLPYIIGYYAIGFNVTFCALSRSQDRVICTDLYSFNVSSPSDRVKALVPCYRLACLLPLLADRCINGGDHSNSGKKFCFSDFDRFDNGDHVTEMTPNTVTKYYTSKRKWTAVKEIYDFLDLRVPHAEHLTRSSERNMSLTFKPRGVKVKPRSVDQLVESLMCVTKALVALHDLSFMHRDLGWDKVALTARSVDWSTDTVEWILCGFEEAADAPQLNPREAGEERGRHAPEMGRGLHGVKVDVWGVGFLIRTCELRDVKMLKELETKCLEPNPELRPTAADCYHYLLQVQSAASPPY
ncbi:PREDICTED: uncharacterized protein LOC104825083 [Tarenaya hassleriana]|uniref:uncharacterized protein LOC104825083 n=1 Tax=Tarenaya hassleriana TaxID=28532 RepID=UPI00053C9937|nr:PREDICTED: uncharacterized protein LOC104825083 [Tarenaya hassleriana]